MPVLVLWMICRIARDHKKFLRKLRNKIQKRYIKKKLFELQALSGQLVHI